MHYFATVLHGQQYTKFLSQSLKTFSPWRRLKKLNSCKWILGATVVDNVVEIEMNVAAAFTCPIYNWLQLVFCYQMSHSAISTTFTLLHIIVKCMKYEVEGSRPRDRPKKTWRQVVQKDYQARNLNREDAMDHGRWKKLIKIGWWSGWWVGECFFWYWLTWVVPGKGP